MKALRPYQVEMLAAVAGSPARRQLVQAATGTGKTVTFAAMPEWPGIRAKLDPFGRWSTLVLAHREELIDQAAEKLQLQNPDAMVSVEQGDRYSSPLSTIVVASVQTLEKKDCARLKRLMQGHAFRLVVVDEAHHAAASSYRAVLTTLGFLPPGLPDDDVSTLQAALVEWEKSAPNDRLLVGVTATPNRSDAVGLGCVFQSMVFTYPLRKAIDDGYLVPLVAWSIETRQSLDDVRTVAGEFNQKQLAEAVNVDARNRLALSAWRRHADEQQTLAFTVDVDHAHKVAAVFKADGVPAEAVHGETPRVERRQMLQAYTDGRIRVLANCMILTEGTDLPATSCILHLKPTKSATLYEQMTGRGLRLFEGKRECVIIDLVDVARKHSLQTAPILFGLPPSLVTSGQNLTKLKERYDLFAEKMAGASVDVGRKTIEQLEAIARQVDIWNLPSMGELGRVVSLEWMPMGEKQYRIRYPWEQTIETLDVVPDLVGNYTVTASWRALEKGLAAPEPVVLARGLSSSYAALRAAEQYVQTSRSAAHRLKDKNAPWKSRPASEKQLAILAARGIQPKARLTAGEASMKIDQLMGGRRS